MRITDVIDEFIIMMEARPKPVANAGGIPIYVDMDHVTTRMWQRQIQVFEIMGILDELDKISDQIWQIELGHRAWIFSPTYNISIGLHRYGQKAFTFKTVVRGKPYDGDKELLEIPA